MSKKAARDASLEALLAESGAGAVEQPEPIIDEKPVASLLEREETAAKEEGRGRGRPHKRPGKKQQIPTYIPEGVYFKLLEYVAMTKRTDRQYSMNEIVNEALELWLKDKNLPSVDELIASNGK